MTDSIAAQVAALPKTPPELRQMWRELFDREPPGFSRNYLISRLAYRIQELAYGGPKPATRARLDALAEMRSIPRQRASAWSTAPWWARS
jgi:hypothetical protein